MNAAGGPLLKNKRVKSWAMAAVAALLLWGMMYVHATSLPFNYDEIAEAHATWQISHRARPYTDFHYDHPPFFWLAYAPLIKILPENFRSLVVLRLVDLSFAAAAFLSLGFLVISLGQNLRDYFISLGALLLMATQFPVLQTFAEFRADSPAFAFQLAGMFILERAEAGSRRRWLWAVGGVLLSIASLFSLKIVSLTVIFLAVHTWDGWRMDRLAFLKNLASFGAGVAVSIAAAGTICLSLGIDFRLMYVSVFQFHRLFMASYGISFGLAKSLWDLSLGNPALFVLFALGVYGLMANFSGGARYKPKAVMALALFCLLQPLWVRYPWRQYAAGLLLCWAAPLAVGFIALARGRFARLGFILIAGLTVFSFAGEIRRLNENRRTHYLDKHIQAGNQLIEWTSPGDFVAAQPPFHPVFRKDSTYFFTYPLNPGGDTEELFTRLPELRDKFTPEAYRRQLCEHPPRLIVLDPNFAGKNYVAAIREFLAERIAEYSLRHVGPLAVYVRAPASEQ